MKLKKRHLAISTTKVLRTSILQLFLFCALASSFAQSGTTVTGVVKGQTGEALIGVSVKIKDGKTGTVTDTQGKFSLVVQPNSNLVFSYVGYTPQTVSASQSPLTVVLNENNLNLNEVVVIGFGTSKKRDLTGAITTVKNDVITLTPSTNPMEALQGRVAGLDITKTTGQAGQGVTMQLRGIRSFSASGSPLFIIDGLPGDYSTLNPNDIESIEVLKDASTTAVYGSIGSNGVIIVSTKKGKEGKMNVNFNTYAGFNGWSTMPKMRSGDSYISTIRLAQQEAGTYTDETDFANSIGSAVYTAYQKGQNIDWAKSILHTGNTQNYSLSISSATAKSKVYYSLNYSTENGQYTNDTYKLLSSNIRLDNQINKVIATGVNIQGSYTMKNYAYSKLYNALVASPFGSLYDDNGVLNPYPVAGDNKQVNLLLNEDQDRYKNYKTTFKIFVNPYIRITPLKGLSIESRINGTLNYSNTQQFIGYGSYQFYDALGTGALNATQALQAAQVSATVGASHGYSYKWENILTYNFKVAKSHEFTFTGATTYDHSQTDGVSSGITGISSNSYYWTNLAAGTGVKSVGSSYSMTKTIGLVQRLSYSYLGRYLFSASMREDASSVLDKNHRWNSFPSVSAGWRISDERFMQSTKSWLDNLKLRVGHGMTGLANIPAYNSWSILQQSNLILAGNKSENYYYPSVVTNPLLTWEKSYNTNVGIDASFLNNRIDLTADAYVTNTDGVIWTKSLPVTNGATSASAYYTSTVNLASTQAKGLEVSLTTRNIVSKNFNWTSTITYSKMKDEVTSLGDGSQDYVSNGSYTLNVGSAVNSYYHYKIAGVWQKGEEADAAVFNAKPGDYKIDVPNLVRDAEGQYHKVVNGTTVNYDATNKYAIGANDYQILGHSTPDWSLGFQNTFTYKAFDLSVYAFARYGQMIYYDLLGSYSNSGTTNFPEYFNYWTSTNPSNDFSALNTNRAIKDVTGYYARPFVDASFIKIKNVTLGYTMPQKLCKAIKLEKLRVYGTLTNPLIVAKSHLLKDYDPEMNGSIDYPSTKQLVFGLNLTF